MMPQTLIKEALTELQKLEPKANPERQSSFILSYTLGRIQSGGVPSGAKTLLAISLIETWVNADAERWLEVYRKGSMFRGCLRLSETQSAAESFGDTLHEVLISLAEKLV